MDNYRELKIRCDPGFGHLPNIYQQLKEKRSATTRKQII